MIGKRYQVIYADPPWEYRHCASDNRKIENHYQTMTAIDLKNLSIPAEDNSVLFLWVTAPKVAEAIALMAAWGFDYRSCMIWDKEIIGLGYWSRVQHELMFVGVKGSIPPPDTEFKNFIRHTNQKSRALGQTRLFQEHDRKMVSEFNEAGNVLPRSYPIV